MSEMGPGCKEVVYIGGDGPSRRWTRTCRWYFNMRSSWMTRARTEVIPGACIIMVSFNRSTAGHSMCVRARAKSCGQKTL